MKGESIITYTIENIVLNKIVSDFFKIKICDLESWRQA